MANPNIQPQGQQPMQPNIPPELLMALLTHLAQGGASQQGTPPSDGGQIGNLSNLLPSLLQALAPQQGQTPGMPQAQGQSAGSQRAQPQRGQNAQQGQPQQSPIAQLMQILGSMGLSLGK